MTRWTEAAGPDLAYVARHYPGAPTVSVAEFRVFQAPGAFRWSAEARVTRTAGRPALTIDLGAFFDLHAARARCERYAASELHRVG